MINRTKKAFTLLELIVVLLVLGILAAIAVPTFRTVKENSAIRAVKASAEAVARNADAIAASAGDNGDVAQGDLDTAIAESGSFTHTAGNLYATKTTGGYEVTCTWTLGSPTSVSCTII